MLFINTELFKSEPLAAPLCTPSPCVSCFHWLTCPAVACAGLFRYRSHAAAFPRLHTRTVSRCTTTSAPTTTCHAFAEDDFVVSFV